MEWFRWFHGAVSDDKWPLIARRSGQNVAVVVAVWAALLECASAAADRGSIADFDPDSMDALLQVPDGACQSVVDAMSEGKKPRITNSRIAKWNERQPLREDGSIERAREWRKRKKSEKTGESDNANAEQTQANAGEHTTNANEHRTEQNREDKTREDTRTPHSPPAGGATPARGDVVEKKYSAEFSRFWGTYPKKVGKDAACKAFTRAKAKPAIAELIAAVERQKTWRQWRDDGGKYIPNPATWLNQGRWADEPVQAAPLQRGTSPAAPFRPGSPPRGASPHGNSVDGRERTYSQPDRVPDWVKEARGDAVRS